MGTWHGAQTQGTTYGCLYKEPQWCADTFLDKKTNIKDGAFESLKIISNEEKKLVLSYEKSKLSIDKIIAEIKKQGVLIQDISTDDGDLEDVFLRLTKS